MFLRYLDCRPAQAVRCRSWSTLTRSVAVDTEVVEVTRQGYLPNGHDKTAWPFTILMTRSAFGPHHCEHRALRVEALEDPAAAGNLLRGLRGSDRHRLHARHCAIDGLDVEVIKPERGGRLSAHSKVSAVVDHEVLPSYQLHQGFQSYRRRMSSKRYVHGRALVPQSREAVQGGDPRRAPRQALQAF